MSVQLLKIKMDKYGNGLQKVVRVPMHLLKLTFRDRKGKVLTKKDVDVVPMSFRARVAGPGIDSDMVVRVDFPSFDVGDPTGELIATIYVWEKDE